MVGRVLWVIEDHFVDVNKKKVIKFVLFCGSFIKIVKD